MLKKNFQLFEEKQKLFLDALQKKLAISSITRNNAHEIEISINFISLFENPFKFYWTWLNFENTLQYLI